MRLGGEAHNDFVVYIGRDFTSGWRHRCIYIGLWQRASCSEGEIPWLFEWKWSTRCIPHVTVWGTIELFAFGRCWVWRV